MTVANIGPSVIPTEGGGISCRQIRNLKFESQNNIKIQMFKAAMCRSLDSFVEF
jgi:hypothetical protein